MGIPLKVWADAFKHNAKGGVKTQHRAAQTWRAMDVWINSEHKHWTNITPKSITTIQIRMFIEYRNELGIKPRGVALEAGHIRRACAGAGREIGKLNDPQNNWSSSRLGVPVGDREGGRPAISPTALALARERLAPDVLAVVDLSLALGLRRLEAVTCARDLSTWAKILDRAEESGKNAYLPCDHGTKGGRPRDILVMPDQIEMVRQAVQGALDVAKKGSNGRLCIVQGSLEQAEKRVSNACTYVGMVGSDSIHGCRREWAQDQFARYTALGYETETALAKLSNDLGHGDERGRWVQEYYLSGGRGG